jgi:transcriptional regulator with XRE-family HTH domain
MKCNNEIWLESMDDLMSNPDIFSNYYTKIYDICNDLPYSFRNRLRYLRKCRGYTREKLEEKSNVSVQTIKQIENDAKRGYSVKTIVALCIGMNLPPEFSFELIKKGGFNIETNSGIYNFVYCYILRNMYSLSINDVNDFLLSIGIEPLTD